MTARLWIAFGALWLAMALIWPPPVLADWVTDTIRERAAAHGVSGDTLVRVAGCETAGTYEPHTIGDGGTSFGIFQLHQGGLLGLFYSQGYSDPFNVWESSDFAAWAWAHGRSSHWSCQ